MQSAYWVNVKVTKLKAGDEVMVPTTSGTFHYTRVERVEFIPSGEKVGIWFKGLGSALYALDKTIAVKTYLE